MNYLLMGVSIAFATANSAILRIFKNRSFQTPGDVFFFNGGVSFLWAAILAVSFFVAEGELSLGLLTYGIVYAVILFLFLYFKTEALACGPVALTSLIGSAAFLIPTLYGAFLQNETPNFLQVLGMLLITLSLFLCVSPRKGKEKLSLRWFIFCFGFFVAGGSLGIFYKLFGSSAYQEEVDSLMLVSSLLSAALFFLFGASLNRIRNCAPPKIHKSSLPFLLSSGLVGCIYIRLNISLSVLIPSAIFFPVSNGALVLLSTVVGYAFFQEKLSFSQIMGLLLGLAAIVMTGCSQGILVLLA